MNEATENEYLTAGEVARLLHVSPKTISRWATDERIPCLVTLGGHRRFHRDDVEEVRRRMAEGAGPGRSAPEGSPAPAS